MAVASQFSLEEENFYKDIQDLVKKGNQNEKELSTFLERYMDLIGRSDLDDETFIINFTKAAYIIEASAKVYGTKVDRLWITLERVLESLKVKAQNQKRKKSDDDEGQIIDDAEGEGPGGGDEEDPQKKLPSGRRRKKVGEALSSPEDFVQIDIISGLGKSMNDTKETSDKSIKFYEKIPNLFIKNKSERKRIDVCLIKTTDDRDDSRLRDWIISPDHMLVKEMYISSSMNDSSILNFSDAVNNTFRGDNILDTTSSADDDNGAMDIDPPPSPLPNNESLNLLSLANPVEGAPNEVPFNEEANNNENIPDLDLSAAFMKDNADKSLTLHRDMIVEAANLSEEIDLNREANIRQGDEECLVDVNEMFWNATKFDDVIPSKKMRSGKTLRRPCPLCVDKRKHKKKGKRCVEEDKTDSLDSYFGPLVEPVVKDPLCGYLPDEELFSVYKMEKNLIEQLGRIDNYKNINEAYHPNESPEELMNFAGFVGFENYLMTKKPEYEDEELPEDLTADHLDDPPDHDDPIEEADQNQDFDVPLPVTDYNVPCRDLSQIEVKDADELEKSRLEYQRIVLKETQGAKTCFERNKELGLKISQWHSSLVDKIKLSQERGALNMNLLASKIMDSFPQPKNGEKPVLTFRELVKKQNRKDIPRYFLACLQLTNEGNIDIHKLDPSPLTVDCMALTKLRGARTRTELDEYTPHNSSKLSQSPSKSPAKRKRDLISTSLSSDSEDEHLKTKNKKSKTTKQVQKSRKRRSSSSSDHFTSKTKKKQKNA